MGAAVMKSPAASSPCLNINLVIDLIRAAANAVQRHGSRAVRFGRTPAPVAVRRSVLLPAGAFGLVFFFRRRGGLPLHVAGVIGPATF
jgi:hypothetical protein